MRPMWSGWGSYLVLATAVGGATVVAARGAALLRQAQGVGATAESGAGGLADTADHVGAALERLAENRDNTGHFYWGVRFFVAWVGQSLALRSYAYRLVHSTRSRAVAGAPDTRHQAHKFAWVGQSLALRSHAHRLVHSTWSWKPVELACTHQRVRPHIPNA